MWAILFALLSIAGFTHGELVFSLGYVAVEITRKELRSLSLTQLMANATNATAYFNLAQTVRHDETIELPDGRLMSKEELFVEALKHNETIAEAYFNLAFLRPDPNVVLVMLGRAFSQLDLYVESIRYNNLSSAAYNNLGRVLSVMGQENVRLHDNRVFDKIGLLVESIRHFTFINHRDNAYAFENLAYLLPNDTATVRLASGETVNKKDLFCISLSLNPAHAEAYNSLALLLKDKHETTTLPDGRVMNKKQLFVEALSHNMKLIWPYKNLLQIMGKTETVTLANGKVYCTDDILKIVSEGLTP